MNDNDSCRPTLFIVELKTAHTYAAAKFYSFSLLLTHVSQYNNGFLKRENTKVIF